jgi:hypothetical protein
MWDKFCFSFLAVTVLIVYYLRCLLPVPSHYREGSSLGIIGFACTAYLGLVEAVSNHVARGASESIVKPIVTFLVVANEDLRKRSLDEITADAQRAKTIPETILKVLGD